VLGNRVLFKIALDRCEIGARQSVRKRYEGSAHALFPRWRPLNSREVSSRCAKTGGYRFEIGPDLPAPRFGSSVGAKLSSCSATTSKQGKDLPYPGYGRSEAQSGSMVEVTPVLREFSVLPDTTCGADLERRKGARTST
jgi:hypothetical protein